MTARADAGYRKTMEVFVQNVFKKAIEISQRITRGWAILAKRWVIERTFTWLNQRRRLSKDYEIALKSAENNIMIAHSALDSTVNFIVKIGSKTASDSLSDTTLNTLIA